MSLVIEAQLNNKQVSMHDLRPTFVEEEVTFEQLLDIQRQPIIVNGPGIPRVMKDPCLIVNGEARLIGTQGKNDTEDLGVLTASSPRFGNVFKYDGKWQPTFLVQDERPDFCAPGGVYDTRAGQIIAAVQTRCFTPGGRIELIQSPDGVQTEHLKTLFQAQGTEVIYDPHIFKWDDKYYMTLSVGPRLRDGQIYVASCDDGWSGNWNIHEKPIYRPEDNPIQAKKAEWNMEGPNIGQVDDLAVMLSVAFVEPGRFGSNNEFGSQQRVSLGFANHPLADFVGVAKPLLDPRLEIGRKTTENGHPAWVTDKDGRIYQENNRLYFTYQGRDNTDYRWGYHLGSMDKKRLLELGRQTLSRN